MPPGLYFGVIATAEHIWDFPAPKLGWSRVLGLFKQSLSPKTLRDRRLGVPHHPRKQSSHSFDDETRSHFASGKHHVSHRYFVVH
jgi:hypothetical protein